MSFVEKVRFERYSRASHKEYRQYRLLLTASLPFFLIAAVISRLAPRRLDAGAPRHRSVFDQAVANARAAIPMVFMG